MAECKDVLPECAGRLARIEEQNSHQTELLTSLVTWFKGNGVDGADKRIDRLEQSEAQRSDEKKWFKRLVIGAIVVQSVVLVVFAIKGI
jgi:hypothetical protein